MGGALVVTAAGGGITLGATEVGGTATIATTGAPADIVLARGLTAADTVRLTSTRDILAPFVRSGGDLFVTAARDVAGVDPGVAPALTAGEGRMLALSVGGALRLGALTGGGVTLSAGSLDILSVDAGTATVDLRATAGDLTIGGPVRGGDVTLMATGATTLGDVMASGALTLQGGTALSFGDVSGAGVAATSGGALTGDTVASSAGATLVAAGALTLGSATAAGDLALRSTGGELRVAGAVRGAAVTIAASGQVGLDDAAATGALSIASGAGLTFGDVSGAGVALSSAGALTGGTVSSGAGATIAAAGPLTLSTLRTGAGAATLTSGGDATLGAASVAGDLSLTAAGAAGLPGVVAATGRYQVRGSTVSLGAARQSGAAGVSIVADRGAITGAAGLTLAGGPVSLDAAGAIALAGTAVEASGAALGLRSGGAITLGTVAAGSIVSVRPDGTSADALAHTGALTLESATLDRLGVTLTGGELSAGTLTIAGAGAIEAGAVSVDGARAGSLTLTATGAVGGRGGGRTTLATTAGDLSATAGGAVRIATAASAGALSIVGETVDAGGALSAARAALVRARTALTAASATAGGDLTLEAGGDVQLGEGRAGGAALVDAGGVLRLGRIAAGPSLTLRGVDAELTGVQSAGAVRVENRAAATRTLRLGDTATADGFRLSGGEVGLFESDTLSLDGGTGAVEIGTLAFDADAGRRGVDILGTGAISVTGAVSGVGRPFRIGGNAASATAGASALTVVATSTGGGRLLFAGADLELRGDRIAVGLAPGFLDLLGGADAAERAEVLTASGASSLFNAGLGGGTYAADAPTTVSARSLTVRYGQFALFQNTGAPGQSSGVVLGDPAAPVRPALRLFPTGAQGSDIFALFGTVNGIGGTPAALLGPDVLATGAANLAGTRVNGCLVGSGGGCLRTVVVQPRLQVFDQSREDVFGIAEDLLLPFDPVIGGANEELLVGLDGIGADVVPPPSTLPATPPLTIEKAPSPPVVGTIGIRP